MQPNEQLIAILGSLREQQTRDVTFVLAGESVSKGNHKELARRCGEISFIRRHNKTFISYSSSSSRLIFRSRRRARVYTPLALGVSLARRVCCSHVKLMDGSYAADSARINTLCKFVIPRHQIDALFATTNCASTIHLLLP